MGEYQKHLLKLKNKAWIKKEAIEKLLTNINRFFKDYKKKNT